MPLPKDDGDESILQEAQRLTHGSRNADYGHPLDDYTRTANLINSLFAHKLCEPLTPEDAASIQILVKLSRHQNAPKRDNMVDAAGYAWVAWACTEERARRKVQEVGDLYQLTSDPLQPEERIIGMRPELAAGFGTSIHEVDPPKAPALVPGRLTLACGCHGYCKGGHDFPQVLVVPTGTVEPLPQPIADSTALCTHGYVICSVCNHPKGAVWNDVSPVKPAPPPFDPAD